MCKLFSIIGIRNSKLAEKVTFAAARLMSANDNHGFGYAATDGKCMWTEKWLVNKDAFKQRNVVSKEGAWLKEVLGDAVVLPDSYSATGERGTPTSIILHARFATCDKTIANTHPFVDGDVALIHNGIIHANSKLVNKTSTCDSERILNEYVRANVRFDLGLLDEAVSNLSGYLACMTLAKDAEDRWIVDVWRDNKATLYLMFSDRVGWMIATTEELLRGVCASCRVKPGEIVAIAGYAGIRFNSLTGDVVQSVSWTAPMETSCYKDYTSRAVPSHTVGMYDTSEAEADSIEAWSKYDDDLLTRLAKKVG